MLFRPAKNSNRKYGQFDPAGFGQLLTQETQKSLIPGDPDGNWKL